MSDGTVFLMSWLWLYCLIFCDVVVVVVVGVVDEVEFVVDVKRIAIEVEVEVVRISVERRGSRRNIGGINW
mgnify:CR=1 FL=1